MMMLLYLFSFADSCGLRKKKALNAMSGIILAIAAMVCQIELENT